METGNAWKAIIYHKVNVSVFHFLWKMNRAILFILTVNQKEAASEGTNHRKNNYRNQRGPIFDDVSNL